MYLADMYCYGMDPNAVGCTGISGCMGVFVAHGAMLYAVHIPDNNPAKNARGGQAFADFALAQAGRAFNADAAEMIVVANHTQRSTADDEGYAICRRLGMRRFTLVRPEKFIALSESKNPESIFVVWQRTRDGGLELLYRRTEGLAVARGTGTARSGDYGAFGEDERYEVDTAAAGWHAAKPPNAHGMRFHDCVA